MSVNNTVDTHLKVFPIPELSNNNILSSKLEFSLSEYPARQLFSTGFNYFIHQSYVLFDELIKEQGTKQFYWVVNNFEIYLTDQEKKYELIDTVKDHLNIDNISVLENSLFFQIWEMNIIFDFIEKNTKINLVTNKNEIIRNSINKYVERTNILNKTKNTVTYTNKNAELAILLLDEPKSLTEIESNYFRPLIKNTYDILLNLNDNGNLIVELDDLYTLPTIKYICLMKSLFRQVYIHKPYYSRSVYSQKYLICKDFSAKDYKKIVKKLEPLINLDVNTNLYVIDFILDFEIPNSILTVITYINIYLGGIQHREKNKIIKYIKSEDYFGDKYKEYFDAQMLATQFYLASFFPIDKNDYLANSKKMAEDIQENSQRLQKYNVTKQLM